MKTYHISFFQTIACQGFKQRPRCKCVYKPYSRTLRMELWNAGQHRRWGRGQRRIRLQRCRSFEAQVVLLQEFKDRFSQKMGTDKAAKVFSEGEQRKTNLTKVISSHGECVIREGAKANRSTNAKIVEPLEFPMRLRLCVQGLRRKDNSTGYE